MRPDLPVISATLLGPPSLSMISSSGLKLQIRKDEERWNDFKLLTTNTWFFSKQGRTPVDAMQ